MTGFRGRKPFPANYTLLLELQRLNKALRNAFGAAAIDPDWRRNEQEHLHDAHSLGEGKR